MTETDSLNEYSKRVFDYLKNERPELVHLILIKPCSHAEGNYLKMEMRSPNNKAAHDLTFDTNDNQLTLCFDGYHEHFDNLGDMNFTDEISRALDTMTGIMKEELLVVTYQRDNNPVMSGLMERSDLTMLADNLLKVLETKADRVLVVSWTGSLDQQIGLP